MKRVKPFKAVQPVQVSAEGIVRGLAEMLPGFASETDGCLACYFCGCVVQPGAALPLEEHELDCLWREAKEFLIASDSR